jgi:hypothetical protein
MPVKKDLLVIGQIDHPHVNQIEALERFHRLIPVADIDGAAGLQRRSLVFLGLRAGLVTFTELRGVRGQSSGSDDPA